MIRYLIFVSCVCMPAICAGMQSPDGQSIPLVPGERKVEAFAGKSSLRFTLDARGPVRITVQNIGRDAVMGLHDASGETLLRAAGWRRGEHYYIAAIDLTEPVTVVLSPDDPNSPAGQVGVLVERMSANDPEFAAERVMTQAMDRNLAYYYGEGDTRTESLRGFEAAAGLFAAIGIDARNADALFEAANVNMYLCDRQSALTQLEEARELWQGLQDERGIATAENLAGLIRGNAGDNESAIRMLRSASDRRRQTNGEFESFFYAESVNNLGLAYRRVGDARRASQYFRLALDEWDGNRDLLNVDLNDTVWKTQTSPFYLHHSLVALGNIGWANEVYGDLEESERIWNFALELADELADNDNRHAIAFPVATIYNNMGNLKRRTGDMEDAMFWLDKALVHFTKTMPNQHWAALANFNIGQVYRDLGRDDRAAEYFEKSLELRNPECDPVGRAQSLAELAALSLQSGDTSSTLRLIADAEALLQPLAGNAQSRAALADLAGRAYYADQRYGIASARHQQAIRLYREVEDRNGEMLARTNDASVALARGDHLETATQLLAALGISEEIDAPIARYKILQLLGETYLADNQPERAVEYAGDAIALSEETRRKLVKPNLLRQFSGIQRDAYDVLITAKLGTGDEVGAWLAADEARARRFTDVIRQEGVDLKSLTDEQADRYRHLRRSIALRAETRSAFLSRNDFDSADRLLTELRPLLDEMDLLQEIARRSSELPKSRITLAGVRQDLGPTDLILEYYVGNNISGVWSIARDSEIVFWSLPSRSALRDSVESVLNAIRDGRPLPSEDVEALSRELLGQDGLVPEAKTNLIVIPDGPLHLLPFSALPDPVSEYRDPVVERRTVTYLASLAAYGELQARESRDASGIAILADPVFAQDSSEGESAESESQNQVAFLDRILLRSGGFEPLPGTRQESEAIQEAAGEMEVFTLYGHDANRNVVMSGSIDSYRILHFATHGVLDDREPALSGLVLSEVQGDSDTLQPSVLRSQDIAGLSINAQLVVLSGCETALGQAVPGEGLVGLSRAFFYAGAEQVVATLWPVADRSTPELMKHFYQALLSGESNTAVALQQAKNAIRSDPRWRNPFYWAPFVLQGDWK